MIRTTAHIDIPSLESLEWIFLNKAETHELSKFLEEPEGLTCIRFSPNRVTYYTSHGYFIKVKHFRGLRALLRSLAFRNIQMEAKKLHSIKQRGIQVPEVVAAGIRKKFKIIYEDILITKEIQGAIELTKFLKHHVPTRNPSNKRAFVKQFGKFIAQVHEAGVYQKDLHIGNIMVRETPNNTFTFYLLDAQRIKIYPYSLPWDYRLQNLAILLSNFWFLSSITQRFRFLNYYLRHQNSSYYEDYFKGTSQGSLEGRKTKLKKVILEIQNRALKHSSRVWKKKTNRSLKTNSSFVRDKKNGYKVFRTRNEKAEKILSKIFPDPDNLLKSGEIVKNGRTVKAAKIKIGDEIFFIKRYNCKGWLYKLKNLPRRSRAIKTWYTNWGLLIRSTPVITPVACLEKRHFGLLKRSYIIYEYVDDAEKLSTLWNKLNLIEKQNLLEQTIRVIKRLHFFGGFHGDLKWNNILVYFKDNRRSIILTDLDGSKIYLPKTPEHKQKKDFERFIRDLYKHDRSGRLLNLSTCSLKNLG